MRNNCQRRELVRDAWRGREVLMKIGNTQQTNSQLSQIGSLPRHIATAAAAERRAAAVLEPGPRLQNA